MKQKIRELQELLIDYDAKMRCAMMNVERVKRKIESLMRQEPDVPVEGEKAIDRILDDINSLESDMWFLDGVEQADTINPSRIRENERSHHGTM